MLFKSNFIRFSTSRAIKKSAISRESISFKEAKIIGLIFSWEGEKKVELIEDFVKELEISGKNVKCLVYRKGKGEIMDKDFDYFNENDFTGFGKYKNELLEHFTNAKFDFLFHLDKTQNIYIEHILAHSHARCRVSRVDYSKQDLYDLMVQVNGNENLEELFKQILYYTKSIVNYG